MIPRPVILVTTALLVLALLPWPQPYYQLLRLVVCPVAAWVAVVAFRRDDPNTGVGAVVLALTFNPLIPVYLDRLLWSMIDVGAALYLVVGVAPRVGARASAGEI